MDAPRFEDDSSTHAAALSFPRSAQKRPQRGLSGTLAGRPRKCRRSRCHRGAYTVEGVTCKSPVHLREAAGLYPCCLLRRTSAVWRQGWDGTHIATEPWPHQARHGPVWGSNISKADQGKAVLAAGRGEAGCLQGQGRFLVQNRTAPPHSSQNLELLWQPRLATSSKGGDLAALTGAPPSSPMCPCPLPLFLASESAESALRTPR